MQIKQLCGTCKKFKWIQRLAPPIVCFLFATSPCEAQSRDPLAYHQTQYSLDSIEQRDLHLGLPPLGKSDFMILNSFKSTQISERQQNLAYLRWAPGFRSQLDENKSLFATMPFSFGSTGTNPVLSEESRQINFIMSISKKMTEMDAHYSYGLLALDLQARTRIFPIVGFVYNDRLNLIKYSIGYPAVSITYSLNDDFDFIAAFARESGRFYVERQSASRNQGSFIEQNLNAVSLGVKIKTFKFLRLGLNYSRYFSSSWNYLNEEQQKLSSYKDFSGESSVALSISFGPPPPEVSKTP